VKISHDNFTDKSPRLDKIVEDGDSLNWVEKNNQLPGTENSSSDAGCRAI
jgi:RNA polymerase sigma-70 factor (ECF subfamily)